MKEVTAAIIIKEDKILIARRAPGENQAGKWEFPGGKTEPGETPEQCLKREIREEFDVDIKVLEFFAESIYDYQNGTIKLLAFWCQWLSGDFTLKVHSQLAWVTKDELDHYDFAPADIPIVKKLKAEIKLIALIRGINVGRAKRVAMADLRALVEELGYSNVQTLLNSGNIVFTASSSPVVNLAVRLEEALSTRLGVSAKVLVLTAAELATVVEDNPLDEGSSDPSRLLVAFLGNPEGRTLLNPLLEQDWNPEALAIGVRAAYLWCPDGVLGSRLAKAVARVLGDTTTTRNWATVMKLHALNPRD